MNEPATTVVHHATSPSEALVVKGVLEQAGIRVTIPDSNTPLPGVDLTPSNTTDGVVGCEVMVAASDAERARQALRDAREAGRLLDEE